MTSVSGYMAAWQLKADWPTSYPEVLHQWTHTTHRVTMLNKWQEFCCGLCLETWGLYYNTAHYIAERQSGSNNIPVESQKGTITIDLMHWRQRLHNNDAMLGVKTCRVARTCFAGRAHWRSPSQSVCAPGPARRWGMQGFALWVHAWRWCTWRASFDPQHHGGALLWRHMHMVYRH